jgi:hypothetical protein
VRLRGGTLIASLGSPVWQAPQERVRELLRCQPLELLLQRHSGDLFEMRSRADRIIATASNRFCESFIGQDLSGSPDFQHGIATAKVHRVESMDSEQVDYMPEVPAHQDIDSGYCGDRSMLGIGQHPGADHT